jgi:hypothetical protein
MRLLRLFAASLVLLVPPVVIAQHSVAPLPSPPPPPPVSHSIPIVSHVSPAPAISIHNSGIAPAHAVGANPHIGVAHASPAVPKINGLSAQPTAQHTKGTMSPVPATTGQPLKSHHFWFVHRHQPEKSRNSDAALRPTAARRSAPLPEAPSPHIGCTVAAVPLNSGIPCNPLSPCCP